MTLPLFNLQRHRWIRVYPIAEIGRYVMKDAGFKKAARYLWRYTEEYDMLKFYLLYAPIGAAIIVGATIWLS